MALFCAFFVVACGFDYCKRRIPNWLIILIILNGFCFRFDRFGPMGIFLFSGQAVAVFLFFYFLFRIGAFGAGDVKLLSVTAGYLPFEKIFLFLFLSLLISAIISLILLVRKKQFLEGIRNVLIYGKDFLFKGEHKSYPGSNGGNSLTICLSGPMFLSLLLYLGGVY